jgi:hypothetical protein
MSASMDCMAPVPDPSVYDKPLRPAADTRAVRPADAENYWRDSMRNADILASPLSELIHAYRAAAIAYGDAIGNGRYRVANRSHDLAEEIRKEISARGPEVDAALHALLTDAASSVRLLAAAHTMENAPDKAVATLEALVAGPPSSIRLMAEITLAESRKRGRA